MVVELVGEPWGVPAGEISAAAMAARAPKGQGSEQELVVMVVVEVSGPELWVETPLSPVWTKVGWGAPRESSWL